MKAIRRRVIARRRRGDPTALRKTNLTMSPPEFHAAKLQTRSYARERQPRTKRRKEIANAGSKKKA